MKRLSYKLAAAVMTLVMLSGCASGESSAVQSAAQSSESEEAVVLAQSDAMAQEDIEEEAVALSDSPSAVPLSLKPEASGIAVKNNGKAEVDYSNVDDGYVMVQYTAATSKKLKARVQGPSGVIYTYNLTPGEWAVFSLPDGSGSYKVTVYENISGTKYATTLGADFTANLKNEFVPFLLPNQYVDYSNAPNTLKKAEELTKNLTDPLEKVKAVYTFVVKNMTYDKAKTFTVQSGYVPVLDTVLAEKKGICFDYAALMAGMLRSQNVPCKLIIGYSGTIYHAWLNVYSEESGWINGVVFFDGTTWKLMDPTFASTGKQSAAIMKYIGDDSNYSAKYIY